MPTVDNDSENIRPGPSIANSLSQLSSLTAQLANNNPLLSNLTAARMGVTNPAATQLANLASSMNNQNLNNQLALLSSLRLGLKDEICDCL